MRIQLLGPVRAWRDGEPLDLGPSARRVVLSLLALAGGKPLLRAELMSGLWYDREPPTSAANVIQTHVKHLRRLLEPERRPRDRGNVLRLVGDGYALHLPDAGLDVTRFRQRIGTAATAQRCGQFDRAAELLGEALALWHGPPLADIPTLASHPKVVALAGERQAALGRYGEVMIAAGRSAEGLPILAEAAVAAPLDEAAHARLIRAYHAAGRRGQAFAAYHEVRRRLADDLGVVPGPELAAAHAALLHDEEAGVRPPRPESVTVTAARSAPRPAQLPADLAEFAGRTTELARLDGLLDRATRPPGPAATVVAAVSGTAGVGKTTLAVHWAHRVAHRFPDGQLYVNLRGFDPVGPAVQPAEAVRQFLDALGVPAERIPTDLDAQAALYRSQMFHRRMLVLLDNARDAAQLRPLLPGGPGCLVLVTSRARLADLVAIEGAGPVPVGPLPAREARELLLRRIGGDRAGDEPQAVAEILARCAGLPLALAIVAARVATDPDLSLADLANQLRRGADRLDALSTGDPTTDLRAVFSWSYRSLRPAAARLFRLIGLHPGPDLSAAAAASLAGRPPAEVRETLAELTRANLLGQRSDGRYTPHDLLRAYAAEMAERTDSEPRRRGAVDRLIDHYVQSGNAADELLRTEPSPVPPGRPGPGVTPERPGEHQRALDWFAAERVVLLAVLDYAAGTGRDAQTWQLAWALGTYLDRSSHWYDLVGTQRAAVAAARRLADPTAQAVAHRFLARAYTRLARLDDADAQLRHALVLYRDAGDQAGQGHTHLNLSLMWERRGGLAEALDHARQGLDLLRAAGNRHGEARALNAVGWCHTLLADHSSALAYCERALVRLQELDDRGGQANTWGSLGRVHHHLGDRSRSLRCYDHALRLFRTIGDRHLEGITLSHVGDTHHAFGDPRAAGDVWREALQVLHEVDHVEAGRVRGKLAALDEPSRIVGTGVGADGSGARPW
ncbi:BTAD domain-containing putative transcriptional regulator [Micromonospora sp. WMMD1102]|uniref:AfsR/SARP family transcriptional regulator n=1 Tax=Micromonospora sp. WMMD1102 TaxID=3016105 RepID=UPI002414DF00|nr:BTAD domain-containing putative transcriptional regulator [Micromonospora sp. WMMD1102]MDG4786539.1 BTAD domain-containing putative transcriptional regulator [Micromonospora sp. WMMD1102]